MIDPRDPRRVRPDVIYVPTPGPHAGVSSDQPDPPAGDPAWGRTAQLTVQNPIQAERVARVTLRESQPLTVVLDVQQPPTQWDDQPFAYVWAQITWGTGSGSSSQKFVKVGSHLEVSITGSFVQVDLFLAEANPTVAVDSLNNANYGTAQVSAFVARGNRAIPMVSSLIVNITGSPSGVIVGATGTLPAGGAHVLSLRGHLQASSSGTELFLQIFDKASAPVNGDVPIDELPLGTTPSPEAQWRYLQPLATIAGLSWGVSSTSAVYTAAADNITGKCEVQLL